MKVALTSLILLTSLALFSCGGGSGKKLYLCENAYGDDDGDGVLNCDDDFPKDPTRWKKDRPAISFYDCIGSKAGSKCLPKLLKPAPFTIKTSAKFYKDVSYRSSNTEGEELTRMDLFLPDSSTPTSYVMFIHGGAFMNAAQTKSSYYEVTSATGGNTYRDYINNFLSKNIAFISIDYRLLDKVYPKGIYRSLNDIKYALQFIKKHASSFNLKPEQVALMGNSAGMSSGLWLGLKERAETNSSDPVKRKSTLVKAVAGTEPQASLHVFDWAAYLVFSGNKFNFTAYHSQGNNLEQSCRLMTPFYGVDSCRELFDDNGKPTPSSRVSNMQTDLDMRNYMDNSDPPLYVKNMTEVTGKPTKFLDVVHHPLHVEAIRGKAGDGKNKYKIKGIDTTSGKDMDQFIIDILEPSTP